MARPLLDAVRAWRSSKRHTKGHAVSAPQCTTFCPDGRYRKMASAHLLLPWQAYKQGLITTRGMKVYYALHEMAERRRYTPSTPAHYGVPECHALLGSTLRVSDVEREIDTLCTHQPSALEPLDAAVSYPTRGDAMPRPQWLQSDASPCASQAGVVPHGQAYPAVSSA